MPDMLVDALCSHVLRGHVLLVHVRHPGAPHLSLFLEPESGQGPAHLPERQGGHSGMLLMTVPNSSTAIRSSLQHSWGLGWTAFMGQKATLF